MSDSDSDIDIQYIRDRIDTIEIREELDKNRNIIPLTLQ